MSGPFGSTAWMYNPSTEFYDFEISNSLRQNAGDSAYLHKSQGSGNRRTFTISFWVKRSRLNDRQAIFSASTDGNNECFIWFDTDDELFVKESTSGSTNFEIRTNRKFRDASAWYHIVVAYDTTNGTAGNRVRIYVNGVEETSFANETQPDEHFQTKFNDGSTTLNIGRINTAEYFGGYLAEATLIDGLQLTPSSFGETKSDIWIPKDTAGLTFGTNGLRLQFKQSGTGTASTSTIGADTSGNNNHLTSVNLVAGDVVPDSPTNNFATLNPLFDDPSYPITFSEGNLKSAQTNKYFSGCSTIVMSKAIGGKWYFEASSITDGNFPIIAVTQLLALTTPAYANSTGMQGKQYSYHGYDGGLRGPTNSGIGSLDNGGAYRRDDGWGATFNQDVMSVALDMDNMKVYFAKNGAWQGSGNPAGNANPAVSSLDDEDYVFWLEDGAGADNRDSTWIANFGQDGTFAGTKTAAGNADDNGIGNFLYDVPAGFLSLCTANLPVPTATIDPAEGGSPQDYFNTVLYEGNGSTQSITGVGFLPDFTWIKNRDANDAHALTDSVRGVTKQLSSDTDDGELTNADGLTAFGSDGFSLGDDVIYNTNNESYVAWNWKAGTAFSNDASSTSVGTIDSAGSVSAATGFSIISYTGTGSNATVAHGLSSAPDVVLVKGRSNDVRYWTYWGTQFVNTSYIYLNTNDGEDTGGATITNSAYPTSSVFSIGTSTFVNGSSETYIAYCFHSVNGYSKFGKYTGNGNDDGPFVHLGFRPAWIAMKKLNAGGTSWEQYDTARPSGSNGTQGNFVDNRLILDDVNDEGNGLDKVDILSNGFKLRQNASTTNADGHTYLYLAFAEQPFKYANAR